RAVSTVMRMLCLLAYSPGRDDTRALGRPARWSRQRQMVAEGWPVVVAAEQSAVLQHWDQLVSDGRKPLHHVRRLDVEPVASAGLSPFPHDVRDLLGGADDAQVPA